MNILDLLTGDHEVLRKQINSIFHRLDGADLRECVNEFVARYERYETVHETILFPAASALLKAEIYAQAVPQHEKMRAHIGELLVSMQQALNHVRRFGLRQAFYELCAAANAHFEDDERCLYPLLRAGIEPERLEALGDEAARILSRESSGSVL